jgi:hypothetical protein
MSSDLYTRRGDTVVFSITVTDRTTGGPIDLTGYSIWCTAKSSLSDPDSAAVFQLTRSSGDIEVTGAENNVIRVTIPAAATVGFTGNRVLFYDVQIRSPSGRVTTVVDGKMFVVQDVTRAI